VIQFQTSVGCVDEGDASITNDALRTSAHPRACRKLNEAYCS